MLSALVLVFTGCASKETLQSDYPGFYQVGQFAVQSSTNAPAPTQSAPMILREGQMVNVAFPGSSSLDTAQQIRTDGKIVMPLIGEVTAAGKTPQELQNELIKLYAPQVATKQVIVTVQSSAFTVYVIGAVLRPGPVMSDHPLSALEAIMEAGGVDFNTADLSAVVVIRQGQNGTTTYKLNLKKVLAGAPGQPFYLKPYDILRVPQKFTWF